MSKTAKRLVLVAAGFVAAFVAALLLMGAALAISFSRGGGF